MPGLDAENLTDVPALGSRSAPPSGAAGGGEEERRRVQAIRAVAKRSPNDVDEATVTRAIDGGISADAFRAEVFERMVERQNATSCFPHASRSGSSQSLDDPQVFRRAVAEGQYARVNPAHEVSEVARQFTGLSLVDAARMCLARAGDRAMGDAHAQIVHRALHSTSDFPALMGLLGNHSLLAGYTAVESGIRAVCGRMVVNDFRDHTLFWMADGQSLLKINEHGEYKRSTVREGTESIRILTYGRMIGFTRQLIINDQVGAFDRLISGQGRQVAELETDIIVGQIVGNPKLGDGREVFHTDHNNIGTPAALSIESLKAARLAFRRQKDRDGAPISVTPKYLVVPPELETAAEVILTAIQANRSEDVNVFAGKLTLIVEGKLTDPQRWYLAADPQQVEGLVTAYLAGQEQPFTESRAGWDVDGVEYKVRHDFGATFVDHRGWYRNDGA